MSTLTSDSVASPRWGVPFCGRSGIEPRTRRRPPSSGRGGCRWPLDRVAGWVGGGIAAVFFASLERCSCVNVRTHDDFLDDEQRDSEAPLMLDEGNGISIGKSTAGAADVRRSRLGRRSDKGTRSGGTRFYGDF